MITGGPYTLPVADPAAFDPANPTANSVFLSLIFPIVVPELDKYETPIQGRLALAILTPVVTMAAAYHPTALDPFGRVETSVARRRCNAEITYAPGSPLYLDRQIALAYAVAWSTAAAMPRLDVGLLRSALASWGLDFDICETTSCNDVATPWGLARTVVDEVQSFFAFDGWNAQGSYSRDFNKIPYEDWRSIPFVLSGGKLKSWRPLTEHDGRGYITNQQHVTPFIGWTARPFVLTDAEICDAKLEPPQYNLRNEAELVLARTAALDSRKKMEIEFFDNKFRSLAPLVVQYLAVQGVNAVSPRPSMPAAPCDCGAVSRASPLRRASIAGAAHPRLRLPLHMALSSVRPSRRQPTDRPQDSFRYLMLDFATISTIHDATLVVWKEKVRINAVRPTSFIHDRLGETTVVGYRGPDAEAGQIKGAEWEAYIRTMPHAEYPSGSSCVCRALANALATFDGISTSQPLPTGPLVQPFAAGSSSLEPGKTPDSDLVLAFESWDAVVQVCGQSRLEGGMHVSARRKALLPTLPARPALHPPHPTHQTTPVPD
jgi:hypothetical protein